MGILNSQSSRFEMDDLFEELASMAGEVHDECEEERRLLEAELHKLQELMCQTSCDEGTDIPDESGELQRMIRQLEAECKQACQQEADLKQKVASKGQTLAALVQEQKERARQAEAKPKARYSVNLYRDISKIRWSCDPSDPKSTEVKGFISKPASTKTFKFDAERQSQGFITNSLWAMSDNV